MTHHAGWPFVLQKNVIIIIISNNNNNNNNYNDNNNNNNKNNNDNNNPSNSVRLTCGVWGACCTWPAGCGTKSPTSSLHFTAGGELLLSSGKSV